VVARAVARDSDPQLNSGEFSDAGYCCFHGLKFAEICELRTKWNRFISLIWFDR